MANAADSSVDNDPSSGWVRITYLLLTPGFICTCNLEEELCTGYNIVTLVQKIQWIQGSFFFFQ